MSNGKRCEISLYSGMLCCFANLGVFFIEIAVPGLATSVRDTYTHIIMVCSFIDFLQLTILTN